MNKKVGYIKLGKRNIHFIHLLLIGFSLFALVYILEGSIESAYIAKIGIETKGKIINITTRGSKGVEDYYYQFSYNNRTYSGKTLYLSKKKIGDEVELLFIAANPKKNRVKERLEKTYNIFLKNNPNLK
jgi:hypothetical protein